jgi:hypothetical protein
MYRSLPLIAVLALAALSGCAAPPWSAGKCESAPPPASAIGKPIAASASAAAPGGSDEQRLQAVMADLAQLGPLDPADQDRLLEDLRQSDPSLWPLVLQQFRATLAYRRRAAERNAAEYGRRLPPPDEHVAQASYAAPAEAGDRPRLALRNLTFCTEVLSYGRTKPFDKREFLPDQEALLYAEVENFASEPTAAGYHTSLRSGCRIFDARGTQVVNRDFAATEDYCQSPRRDFFIAYRLRLPRQISPGRYTLRLAIEDLKCRKTGEASIEFAVKEGKAPEGKAERR